MNTVIPNAMFFRFDFKRLNSLNMCSTDESYSNNVMFPNTLSIHAILILTAFLLYSPKKTQCSLLPGPHQP